MSDKSKKYDSKSIDSIYNYAKQIVNHRVREFIPNQYNGTKKGNKGNFGDSIETYYFGLKKNNASEPDFPDAGIKGLELKSTPIKKLKRGNYSAKERLVLNMIDYNSIQNETWETSHFLTKNEVILLVLYLYEQNSSFLDYLIKHVILMKLEGNDREIIRQDWEHIVNKIRRGEAHELSEGETNYLGACRKGWKEKPVIYRNGKEPAKKRAFSFKQNYMTSIIRKLEDSEPIVKNTTELKTKSFNELVINKFNPFKGLDVSTIEKRLNINLNSDAKSYYATLARRMMGVNAKKIEEFEKADVVMKIIRLQPSDTPKESMSFKAFNFKDVATQDWDESEFSEQIEKKFFFVVFQIHKNGSVSFKNSFFWNMPLKDRQEAEKVWKQTKKILNEGVILTEKNGRTFNNLPGSKDNRVAHVRPHGQNKEDNDELPDGRKLTKQCFWLNNTYIKEVVSKNT